MQKIKVTRPIVELGGDEMARVIWEWVKGEIIERCFELKTQYYDLNIMNRDATDDQVTREAAAAIKREGVGVKCAAINPDVERVKEFGLKKAWKSPNAQVRNIIGGTLFRQPIVCRNVPRRVTGWKKPIVVARHAFGDQFAATDFYIPSAGKVTMIFKPDEKGESFTEEVCHLSGSGVAMGMYNTTESMYDFAKSSMQFALDLEWPLYLGTKCTALPAYDGGFKAIFDEVYTELYRKSFEEKGITYEHRMVDELTAFAIKSEGGFVLACKNHDGDVTSDWVAEGFGSLGLMSSALLTDQGSIVQTEAAHGTITRHFRRHQAGEQTSTNPVATIFAWTQALIYRGKYDNTPEVCKRAQEIEHACVETIEAGIMTHDLGVLISDGHPYVCTQDFISEVNTRLQST